MKLMLANAVVPNCGPSEPLGYFICGLAFLLSSGLMRRFVRRPVIIPSGIAVQVRRQKVVEIRPLISEGAVRRRRTREAAS
jgi:hypothetical protein